MKNWTKLPGLWVVVGWVVVYWLTGARTIVGLGDSDELIAAGYNLALPHQPGYPLLTLLVFGGSHLLGTDPATGAHRLAGLIMAAVVGGVTQLIYRLDKQKSVMTAVAVGLVMGASGLIWKHGMHLEVFGLLSLFSVGLFGWTVLGEKKWFGWGVVAGLGLGHHQLLVLTVLPQFLWLIKTKKNVWQPILKGLGVGLGVTLVGLWLIGSRNHPDSWQFENSFGGVVKYFLRTNYSGYSMESGTKLASYFSSVELGSVLNSWKYYAISMWQYWGWWNLAAIWGLARGKRVTAYFGLVAVCFLMSGPVLAGYIAVDNTMIVERMYVLSQVYWGLLVGVGLMSLPRLKKVWLGLAAISLVIGWPGKSLAEYQDHDLYVKGLLEGIPEKSVLICMSDASCFGTYYYQSVKGFRSDVAVVPNAWQFRFGRKTAWTYGGFNYEDNPFRLGEVIGRAINQGAQVYVAEPQFNWITELGLDGKAFWLTEEAGQKWRVTKVVFGKSDAEIYSLGVAECGLDAACGLRQLSFWVWRNPDSVEPRLTLARGFQHVGLSELAAREFRQAKLLGEGFSQFPGQNLE